MNLILSGSNPQAWLLMFCLLAFYWLAWRNRHKALMILILLLPSYIIRTSIFSVPVTFLELLIVGLFLIWIIAEKKYKFLLPRHWNKSVNLVPFHYRLLIVLLLLAVTFSALISPDPLAAWGIWKAYFLEPLMLFLVIIYTIKTPEQAYDLIDILGLLIILLFPLALWQKITGLGIPNDFWAEAATRRVTTVFGYPNANSLLLAPIVAGYGAYLLKKESFKKDLYKVLVIILGLLIVYWARTDGALLALALVAIYLLGRKIKYKKAFLTIVIILAAIVGGLVFGSGHWQKQWQRISAHRLTLESTSLEIRVNQWQETWQLLKHRPLTGAGLAGYQTALKPYHLNPFLEIFLYPHNIIFNFWSELGLIGLMAVILIAIGLARDLRKKTTADPWLAVILSSAFIVMLIHGLVDVPYFKNDLSAFTWLLIALVILNRYHFIFPATETKK